MGLQARWGQGSRQGRERTQRPEVRSMASEALEGMQYGWDKVRQDVEEQNKLIRKWSWPLKQGCSNLHLKKVPGGATGIS